ncbi:MAG: domain S-box protein [Eubacterium sp.]|jgi:PAS domain S-box-containing protein|nr:domain S-box protein [Eubacterium sp.]
MLRLKDTVDEKTLSIIQRMLMQFLHSSTALYEADGSCVYNIFEGEYCNFLIDGSNAEVAENEGRNSCNCICRKDSWRISKESMEKREPVERECSGGIRIYAVPIMYNEQVIGSINAGITNPPLGRRKLEQIAQNYGTNTNEILYHAYSCKRLTNEEIEIARLQLRMSALLISSLYEAKIKQLEAENELRKKSKQLKAIIKNVSSGIYTINLDNSVNLLNAAASRFLYKPSDYVTFGDTFNYTSYFDIEGREVLLEQMPGYRALKGEKVREMFLTAKRPDGIMHYSINSTPIFDEYGNISYALVCSNDITGLVNSERSITEQKEQLEIIIENISDALTISDSTGRLIRINNAAKNMFYNIDNYEYIGETFSTTKYLDLDGNEIPLCNMPASKAIRGETVKNERIHAKRPDKEFYIDINAKPVFDNNGNVLLMVSCCRDITKQVLQETEIKQHQEAVLKAEREKSEALANAIKMKDEFLSIVSHEFKTPLTVINSAIQAMELICRNELTDKSKSFLNKIRQNSFRQLRLVNNLLDITRINAGKIKINKKNIDIVFISKAITETVYLYASNKGIKLTFDSSLSKKIIGIDEEKFERILLNLLSNAIKFTPEGKSILVTLRTRKGKICIQVKDSGLGIPKGKMELIFERFGQVDSSLSRQAEGTGIGLSLVKLMTEALGGTIELKSRVGKGSTFTILLPAEKVSDSESATDLIEINDKRLIQATAVEFSDIYLG